MARKSVELALEDRGRKLEFIIEEMPATRLESWIIRLVLLIAGAGGMAFTAGASLKELTDRFRGADGSVDMSLVLKALGAVEYEKGKPLLDELLGCCFRKIGQARERCAPETVDGYIEDINTLITLRKEAIKLNLGFFSPEAASPSGSPEKPLSATP